MPHGLVSPATAAVLSTFLLAGHVEAKTFDIDIDIVHSSMASFIDHLGFSRVIGVAKEFGGTFEFDAAKREASSLDVKVKVASISTNNARRRQFRALTGLTPPRFRTSLSSARNSNGQTKMPAALLAT
ncbi:hypothetical protein predicted by Glimmer/Critica (plasmid) [Sinorhizobium fredii HH103]|uniref:Lipid/polyisoprenoid-binding YceI-like domain-containing protein n=1 Tax=Sinorhizobium fredii (strain HH103) TaxID=1117943 RepID=G9AFB2_SINF1|nr:hypothetical protein predicted by Glimmer/Critica [Sinorhizobium fredii HH103]